MCPSSIFHLPFSHSCASLRSTRGPGSSCSFPALPVQDAVMRLPLRSTGFPNKHDSISRVSLKPTQPFPTVLLPTRKMILSTSHTHTQKGGQKKKVHDRFYLIVCGCSYQLFLPLCRNLFAVNLLSALANHL